MTLARLLRGMLLLMSSPAAEAVPVIRFRCRLHADEYVEAARAAYRPYYRRQRIRGLIAAPIVLAVMALGLWYARLHEIATLRMAPVLVLLGLGFGYLVYNTFAEHLGTHYLKQQGKKTAEEDAEYEIDEGGLRIRCGPYDWRGEWPAFTQWGETPATLWLLGGGSLITLPRRAMLSEEAAAVYVLFERKITRSEAPRRGFPVSTRGG